MNSFRCASCGLRNFSDSSCCKRCKAEFGEAPALSIAPQLAAYPQPQLADQSGAAHWPQPAYQPYYFPAPIAPLPRPSKHGATNAALWSLLGLALVIGLGIAFFWKAGRTASANFAWQEYTSKDDSFSILMPDKPAETVESRQTLVGNLQMNLAVVDMKERGAYMVGYVDYPAASRSAPPQDVLDGASKGAIANSRSTLLNKKNISLDGLPGVELELEAPGDSILGGGRGLTRIYWAAPRIYIIFVAGPNSPDLKAGATKFLDSFKLKKKPA